jgi:hypothetical protein
VNEGKKREGRDCYYAPAPIYGATNVL